MLEGPEYGDLFLTRKEGEAIRIGKDCEVTVLKVGLTTVRLRITALKTVFVSRAELLDNRGRHPQEVSKPPSE